MNLEFIRCRFLVSGLVQGVGFRPHVYNLARSHGLTGYVGNNASGVFIEVQGTQKAVTAFTHELVDRIPSPAAAETVRIEELTPRQEAGFVIAESENSIEGGIVVPPDIATCDLCFRDLIDRADRRFRYPFVTCARCGPRFTLLRDMPYDRIGTTMAEFRMCSICEAEYCDPDDRRFHAQTAACAACGPRVWFVQPPGASRLFGEAAIKRTQEALADGFVVAIKGIGGFHLACDAANDDSVRRLRERKGRGNKPFALMAATIATIRKYAELNLTEERALTQQERPIVLLRRRETETRHLASAVAPGNNTLGFMLPYSPLHHLLLDEHPLVMTSGNVSDEPIVTDNEAAIAILAPMVDAFLFHDREIHSPCDDSVVRIFNGESYPVRLARGYTPLPIRLISSGPAVLAVGGELKSAFCLTSGERAHVSPHLGDMRTLGTLATFERSVDRFRHLLRIEPEVVACDAHPGYLSSIWAAEFAEKHGLPLVRVWHHHAHIASLLVEHERTGRIIGVCFDGTGYGQDGAVWGGEVFVGDETNCVRAAHLAYVPLPGGDASVVRPYRMALAHLWAAGIEWNDALPCVQACLPVEQKIMLVQLGKNVNATPTSSVGRLFDAIAALIGVRQTITYEAQAAIELEAMADVESGESYDFALIPGEPIRLDPRPIMRQVVRDLTGGIPPSQIAGRFHRGVAEIIACVCRTIRDRTGLTTVGLTGGVFQNMLLLQLACDALRRDGFEILIHHRIPPNDGGLSLGQAAIARSSLAIAK
jgi:hydrogenase maturation protein HypF